MIRVTVERLSYAPAGAGLLLHDISLHAEPGEVLGVLGPNGAGKTTLLRCLYGSARATRGRILFGTQDAAHLSARQRARMAAAVPQESPPDFHLDVRTIVETGRISYARPLFGADPGGRAAVERAMERLALTDLAGRIFSTLSGGEQKRTLVARALAQEPKALVLDEPVNHLDIRHQLELMSLIRRLPSTVIVSLHDFDLAAQFCDRLAILSQGRLVATGTPAEVLTPGLIRQVFGVAARVERAAPGGPPRILASPLVHPPSTHLLQ